MNMSRAAAEKGRIRTRGEDLRKILTFSIVLIISAWLVSCSSNDKQAENQRAATAGLAVKSAGPTFKAVDIDGKMRAFEEFKGKGPLILNFWGTWCPPCRVELPDLKRIYAEYKPQGLEIIGLAVNDIPGKVRDFAAENKMPWVMLMSNNDAQIAFGVTMGIPVTIFVGRDGLEKGRLIGLNHYDDFQKQMAKIL
ncbi:MAG: TlpA disulfide reductase family protein [candidate division Zixibacteria bacterium]|nr:TlpA disulfide reductase family protein [candidate division Zixibacteria bacterium]